MSLRARAATRWRCRSAPGDKVTLVCIDESEECLELGRVKAMAVQSRPGVSSRAIGGALV